MKMKIEICTGNLIEIINQAQIGLYFDLFWPIFGALVVAGELTLFCAQFTHHSQFK